MLPGWFIVISIFIRLISGGQYIRGMLRGKARPNPFTWFLWGVTPLIALAAQLPHGFNGQSLMLLALGVSPLLIGGIASVRWGIRAYLTPFTLACTGIALAGILLWRITTLPELAIIFGIVADIFATLPTLHKAYLNPESEYPLPYLLSICSMVVALLTISDWSFTVYAFPLYMLCINITLFFFALLPLRAMVKRIDEYKLKFLKQGLEEPSDSI